MSKITKRNFAKTFSLKAAAVMGHCVDLHTESTNFGAKISRVYFTRLNHATNGWRRIIVLMDTGANTYMPHLTQKGQLTTE